MEICQDDLEGTIDSFLPIIKKSPLHGDYDLDLIRATIYE